MYKPTRKEFAREKERRATAISTRAVPARRLNFISRGMYEEARGGHRATVGKDGASARARPTARADESESGKGETSNEPTRPRALARARETAGKGGRGQLLPCEG